MSTASTIKNSKSLWPIAIGCYFSVVIVSIAIFITWAVRQDTDLVRKDYYAEELQFQNHLDRINRTQQLNRKPKINYDAGNNAVVISLNGGASTVFGSVHFYRPSDASLDKSMKLSLSDVGSQQIDVRNLANGLWKVRVNWSEGAEEFFAEETVIIGRRQS